MIVSQIVSAFYFFHSIFRAFVWLDGDKKVILIILAISTSLFIITLGLYFIAKRYVFVAKYFANYLIMSFLIFTLEFTIWTGGIFEN